MTTDQRKLEEKLAEALAQFRGKKNSKEVRDAIHAVTVMVTTEHFQQSRDRL